MSKTITVGSADYRVSVGRSHVKVVGPEGTCAPPVNEVAGVSVDTFERGQYKHTSDGEVTPASIAYWIRKNRWRFALPPLKDQKALRLRQPQYDRLFDFKGYHGFPSQCGIQIWVIGSNGGSEMPHRYVVVMVQLGDNPGTSVTNAKEIIATDVLHQLLPHADPDLIAWIEYYPPRGGGFSPLPESYDLVHLRYNGLQFLAPERGEPTWKRLKEKDLEWLGVLESKLPDAK